VSDFAQLRVVSVTSTCFRTHTRNGYALWTVTTTTAAI